MPAWSAWITSRFTPDQLRELGLRHASVNIVVSGLVIIWLGRLPSRGKRWLCAALALVVGGAVGNVIDRIRFGYVVEGEDLVVERVQLELIPAGPDTKDD